MEGFWSAHSHSKYSILDALPEVKPMVDRAKEFQYPALGLTDHGNMAGAAQLYTECRKADIKPLPGVEAYIQIRRGNKNRDNMHMGMLATSTVGYRNLVSLTNQSHRQFYYKPILDFGDLAQAAHDGRLEGIAAMSGCWFGVLPTLLREGDMKAVRNLMLSLDSWFGSGLFIELQHHNIPGQDDRAHVELLHGVANALSLPVLITQDSHYCYAEDRAAHDTMKQLISWSQDDPDSAIFPGDGYHMVDIEWMKTRYSPQQLSDGLQGLTHLANIADVSIPELDSYKLAIPNTGGNPDALLRKEGESGLNDMVERGLVPKSKLPEYRERLEEELGVMEYAGFAGYLLLVQRVCDFMYDQKILFSVRGSASGSLLCWLLEITSLDPVKWGLPFDRFLSRDRTKPPDIDLDIEHRRRDEVIEWISERHHAVRIGTWGAMKLQADEEDGEEKGALIVKWQSWNTKNGGERNEKPTGKELARLKDLALHKPFGNYGVHAAGLMITPDEAAAASVPLMYAATSKTMVTAFDMDDVERLGLVKLDLLNGKTMTALKIAFELSGVNWDDIPFNDAKTYSFICRNETTALFQLEGRTFARGMKQMQPKKFTDLIAAMALYRPAAISAGAVDRFITRRKGKEEVPQRHPVIMDETKETYGILLYQEQVLNILKKIGLTVEEIERARKAIKSSNDKVESAREILLELEAKIDVKAAEAGMSPLDVSWINDAVRASAEYGFNKAHSTSYAVVAYITAYMRCHYPLEFWTGILDAYGDSASKTWYRHNNQNIYMKQSEAYALAAARDGVKILPAHVNKSKKSWTVDPKLNAIRKGLETISKLGPAACAEIEAHQPFSSLDDLAIRVAAKRVTGARSLGEGHSPAACGGAIAALAEANALFGLERDPVLEAERKRTADEKELKAAERAARKVEKEIRAAERAAKKKAKEENL